jgi:hypothetical protein
LTNTFNANIVVGRGIIIIADGAIRFRWVRTITLCARSNIVTLIFSFASDLVLFTNQQASCIFTVAFILFATRSVSECITSGASPFHAFTLSPARFGWALDIVTLVNPNTFTARALIVFGSIITVIARHLIIFVNRQAIPLEAPIINLA